MSRLRRNVYSRMLCKPSLEAEMHQSEVRHKTEFSLFIFLYVKKCLDVALATISKSLKVVKSSCQHC